MKSSSLVNGFDIIGKANFLLVGIKKGSVIFLSVLQLLLIKTPDFNMTSTWFRYCQQRTQFSVN